MSSDEKLWKIVTLMVLSVPCSLFWDGAIDSRISIESTSTSAWCQLIIFTGALQFNFMAMTKDILWWSAPRVPPFWGIINLRYSLDRVFWEPRHKTAVALSNMRFSRFIINDICNYTNTHFIFWKPTHKSAMTHWKIEFTYPRSCPLFLEFPGGGGWTQLNFPGKRSTFDYSTSYSF